MLSKKKFKNELKYNYKIHKKEGKPMEKYLTATDLRMINCLIDNKICFLNNSNLDKEYCHERIKSLEKLREKIISLY